MMEAGLVDHWKDIYLPKPVQCMVDPSSRQSKLADIRNPALVNLRGLFPAFVFLLIGVTLALTTRLVEWIKKLQLWQFMPYISPSHNTAMNYY